MTNERDDEILGRALSRAIETQAVRETPYASSRIGAPRARQGTSLWRVAALAASVVIAGALGSQLLLDRPAPDDSVGVQPTATVAPGATTGAASPTPRATESPKPTAVDHDRIFFSRVHDGLPPISVHSDKAHSNGSAEDRVAERLFALLGVDHGTAVPAGAVNVRPRGFVGVNDVKIEGDTVTVDLRFTPEGWGVSGSSSTIALIQQIVYTATEEPGVRRVLVKNNGQPATIDQAVWTTPQSREDVSFYDAVKSETVSDTQSRPCAPTCPPLVPAVLSNNYSVDSFALGLARFVIQVDSGDWAEFTVSGGATNDAMNTRWSKYAIQIEVKGSEVKPGLEIVDRSPLRAIYSQNKGGSAFYELALDDHRPWRVALLANPDRIVVDIGGHPQALSDTVVVYTPKQGDIGRQFTVTGLSRTFEATTAWRVVDSNRREIAGGFTTASRGTSAVWGTYQIAVQLPASVSGNVTLEVYWPSPRDGADTGLVRVPLVVR